MVEPEGKVILLGSEGCGRGDEDIGFEVLAILLDRLAKRDDTPKAIICWNIAVQLLAEGSPLLPRFKRLEEKGISILAGERCVFELGLTDKMAVGKVANMDEILDLLLHNDVISL